MKRLISNILIFCLLLLPIDVHAEDLSRAYDFDLSISGQHEVRVQTGDILTVSLTLNRTDEQESAQMYAMQDEIGYDSAFFELVEGSVTVYSGVQSQNLTLRDGRKSLYLNFLSQSGGSSWDSSVSVGSFQLRVIGTSGTSTLKNNESLVSLQDGSDSYASTCQDVTIVISTDCTVHFESNGGTEIADQQVHYGEKIVEPDEPTRAGFSFNGWYRNLDQTELWNFEQDTVKSNLTLYAGWAAAETDMTEKPSSAFPWWIPILLAVLLITALLLLLLSRKMVRFETNGGTELDMVSVRRGSLLQKPMTPQKPGALFVGWFTDADGEIPWDFEHDTVKKNITLYARWS